VIVIWVDLADRQIVRRAPVGVYLARTETIKPAIQDIRRDCSDMGRWPSFVVTDVQYPLWAGSPLTGLAQAIDQIQELLRPTGP
jgi:hypothetical protein